MKTINFIIGGTINLYIICLAYVGIISKRELNIIVVSFDNPHPTHTPPPPPSSPICSLAVTLVCLIKFSYTTMLIRDIITGTYSLFLGWVFRPELVIQEARAYLGIF